MKKFLAPLIAGALCVGAVAFTGDASAQAVIPAIGATGAELSTSATEGIESYAGPAVLVAIGLTILSAGVMWVRRSVKKA